MRATQGARWDAMQNVWVLVQELARSAVSEQTLGRVVRELAGTAQETKKAPPLQSATPYVRPAASPLEVPQAGAPPTKVEDRAFARVPQGSQPKAPATPASEATAKGTYLVVHLPQGRTSVYLPQPLMQRLCEHLGSVQAARDHVRQLAHKAPPEAPSRSGWVHQRLVQELSAPAQPS